MTTMHLDAEEKEMRNLGEEMWSEIVEEMLMKNGLIEDSKDSRKLKKIHNDQKHMCKKKKMMRMKSQKDKKGKKSQKSKNGKKMREKKYIFD